MTSESRRPSQGRRRRRSGGRRKPRYRPSRATCVPRSHDPILTWRDWLVLSRHLFHVHDPDRAVNRALRKQSSSRRSARRTGARTSWSGSGETPRAPRERASSRVSGASSSNDTSRRASHRDRQVSHDEKHSPAVVAKGRSSPSRVRRPPRSRRRRTARLHRRNDTRPINDGCDAPPGGRCAEMGKDASGAGRGPHEARRESRTD